jgi:hypothetical protein
VKTINALGNVHIWLTQFIHPKGRYWLKSVTNEPSAERLSWGDIVDKVGDCVDLGDVDERMLQIWRCFAGHSVDYAASVMPRQGLQI